MIFLNPFGFLVTAFLLYLFYKVFQLKEKSHFNRQTKLMLFALVLLSLALSRPALDDGVQTKEIEAREFIIALDVSYSMLADDLKPNRFEVARDTIIKLLHKMPKDLFSIFIFTSNPLLISPPTTDSEIATAALHAVNPEYILTKSTSITALLQGLKKFNDEPKELLLFSDGGEERDIATQIQKAKEAQLKVDVIAVGSQKGAVLKKDGAVLVDSDQKLVISRINPLLKTLAKSTGGFYMELNSAKDISDAIVDRFETTKELTLQTQIKSYTELYYIPLILAFVLLLIAYTKFIEIIPLLVVLSFIPHQSLYGDDGFELYANKQYKEAGEYFMQLEPSKESYYNAGVAFYKAKLYKKALDLFSSIKTKDIELKAKIYYNMGNCAVALKRYDRAKELYKKALNLKPNDKDAKENLLQLYKYALHEKQDVADMMPHVNDKQSTIGSKKNETKEEKENDTKRKNNSKREQSGVATKQGTTGEKKNIMNKQTKQTQSHDKEYKFGYSAYELINKGYINEEHPW